MRPSLELVRDGSVCGMRDGVRGCDFDTAGELLFDGDDCLPNSLMEDAKFPARFKGDAFPIALAGERSDLSTLKGVEGDLTVLRDGFESLPAPLTEGTLSEGEGSGCSGIRL